MEPLMWTVTDDLHILDRRWTSLEEERNIPAGDDPAVPADDRFGGDDCDPHNPCDDCWLDDLIARAEARREP
jgi:hypothetical protein